MGRIDVRPPKPYDYYFDPANYGAVGDGTTDDYAALTATIAAASAAGGGVVRLRNNTTYGIGTTLSMLPHVSMEGGGENSRIKALSAIGTVIQCYNASVTAYEMWLKNFSFHVADNVTCNYGLVIDGATNVRMDSVRAFTPGGVTGSSGVLEVGFYFRNSFRSFICDLDTSKHRVSICCFKFGSALNANHFSTFYTSNSGPLWNFFIGDGSSSLNSHANTCDNFTAQGAKYGLRIDQCGGPWVFNGFYTENVVIPISLGSGGTLNTQNCSITSGLNTITVTTATGVAYGQPVTGTGIPANTYVADMSGTTVTLTNAATATNGTASLTFTPGPCNAVQINGAYLTGYTSNSYSAYNTAQIEILNCEGVSFRAVRFQSIDSSTRASLTITPNTVGSGCVAYARLTRSGTIKDVVVTNPGSGYTTGATCAAGGPGSGATFTVSTGNFLDVNGATLITNGVTGITVTGAGSGWTPPACPIAILYDIGGRISFDSCYYDNGTSAGGRSPIWSGIARTFNSASDVGIEISSDRSGINSSSCRFSKTTGTGNTYLIETYTNTGLMLARIFTTGVWWGS